MIVLRIIITLFKTILFKLKGANIKFSRSSNINLNCQLLLSRKASASFGILKVRRNVTFSVNESGELTIGESCFFNNNCIVACHDSIDIGDMCTFGPNCCVYDHDHRFGSQGKIPGYSSSKVVIGKNVWFGAGCTILKGTVIGDNCVVGAGTVLQGVFGNNKIITNKREYSIHTLEDRDE